MRTSRVELESTDWRQAWEEGLSRFDSKLAALIGALEAPGSRIDIAYQSPSSFAEIITVPVTGSAVHGAARLALADHVGFDLQTNPHGISPITTTKIDGSAATYTLALADQSSVSQTLSAWVERSGCRLSSAFPTSAMMLGDVIDASRKNCAESVSTRLHVDQYGAVLTVVSGGQIRMIRRIEVGFEDFVTALTRPIIRHDAHQAPGSTDSITLKPIEARAILCESGIPGFQSTVDEELRLKGKDILPLIQPALQRMAIEIKQSVRFVLSAEECESLRLKLTGPYGSMPNLAAAICDQIEIPHGDPDLGVLERPIIEAPFQGDRSRAKRLACFSRAHSLVSEQIIATQRTDSLRVGFRAGGVAAAIVMGATAFLLNSQIMSERHSTQNLGVAKVTVEQIVGINEAIALRRGTLEATYRRMGESIGMSTRWSDVLAALPGLIPGSVTLNEIEGSEWTEQEPPHVGLSGIASNTQELTCQESLNMFIDSLNACPLVAGVDLGVTNRIRGDAQTESMRFSIVVNLVATPRLASAGDDDGEMAP